MRKVTLETAQIKLEEYIEASAKQPIIILREGEPVALLVGLARNGKQRRVKLRDVLERAWQEYEEHGGIPHDRFWEELAKETKPRRKKGTKVK